MRNVMLAFVIAPLLTIPSWSSDKKTPDPLMMAKLKESQTLLEGLALNDLAKVQKSAEELLKISKEAQFRKAFKTPQYELHANTFQRAAELAIEKAKAKNLDGATLAYVDMTLSCVRCHQYTREVGTGRLSLEKTDALGQ